MVIRGTEADLKINREGRLSERQQEHLSGLKPFQLAVLPVAIAGIAFVLFGLTRGDTIGWIIAGMGIFMGISGWLRHRQRQQLASGQIDSFIGTLESTKTSPLRMFEAEIIVDGSSYVLLADIGGLQELERGERYRYYIIRGLARMGVIVGIEQP